jgi:hypothetical protein
MQRWISGKASRIIPAVALIFGVGFQFIPTGASAVFSSAFLRLDRMAISTTTSGTVCAKPATVGTEAKVVVTFPSTYTVNTTAANWTVTTTNMPSIGGTAATVWPSIATATTVTAAPNVATFPSGDLTVGTEYCFNFTGTNTLTQPGVAAANQQASIETQTSGAVTLDHSDIALATIANDQIVVSAVVPPTFNFVLSGNTDTFPSNLDPTVLKSTAGRTVTITTNAKGGWITWVKDSAQGLYSATANYTIPTSGTVDGTPSTLATNSEGYVLDTKLTTDAAGGCTVAIDPEYNGVGTVQGGTLSANFQPIAACTGVSPATSNGDIITLIERVAISGSTPAGNDYTDTITVVGAGNF